MPGQSFRGFAEKVALVTGGARGVGRAVALSLALEGAYVVVSHAPDDAEGGSVAAELREMGTLAHAFAADVSSAADVLGLFDSVGETFGRLDLLVNASGAGRERPIEELTDEDWQEVVGQSLKGAFLSTRAALPLMRGRASAAVVNVCSEFGLTGGGGGAAYVAAQAGLVGLTKALARELAPRVRVNCVAVGGASLDEVGGRSSGGGGGGMAGAPGDAARSESSRGRAPAADEVARACLYLLSSDARSITGETLVVGRGR